MAQFLLFADQAAGGAASLLQSPMIPLLLIGMVFYFMIVRPERQRRNTHLSLLESLKKNDRVVTTGGIFGTIVNVHKGDGGDDSVIIKVDESNNTRLKIQRSAIARVVTSKNAVAETEKAGSA